MCLTTVNTARGIVCKLFRVLCSPVAVLAVAVRVPLPLLILFSLLLAHLRHLLRQRRLAGRSPKHTASALLSAL